MRTIVQQYKMHTQKHPLGEGDPSKHSAIEKLTLLMRLFAL